MASMNDRINKLREERIAREKARIEKLRELNLKKYSNNDSQQLKKVSSTVSVTAKTKTNVATAEATTSKSDTHALAKKPNTTTILKKPTAPSQIKKSTLQTTDSKTDVQVKKNSLKPTVPSHNVNGPKPVNITNSRKSLAVPKVDSKPKTVERRKTMIPEPRQSTNMLSTKESVFDRLYKPKVHKKEPIDDVVRLQVDPQFRKKVIKQSELIVGKQQQTFEQKVKVRRSISAVHLKRVHKSELNNCIHKWASIGDNINKENVQTINEDDNLKEEIIVSAVKSERKQVKFKTPLPLYFNTPKPEELHTKLQNWCKVRGKSIDSYHHLQCFGLHHLSNGVKPLDVPLFDDDDENKENIELDHDTDNESFLENNNQKGNLNDEKVPFSADKWRTTSSVTETSDFNDSYVSILTTGENVHHVDELLLGALNDLTELLREGFEWEQCARWLRVLRERFPNAPDSAQYWECRAALEERRGDLHATVQCLEEAIAKGTEHSVVEANLDSLLNKFMQLKISPSNGKKQVEIDPKLVDVKNVFKSTIIRFAVQQAKLRQSSGTPKYTVTPVRRSHRLSRTHTPLRVCSTIQQAKELGAEFRPNRALRESP